MTDERLSLGIIIVNYRTPRLVVECLDSLVNDVDRTIITAVVVDNASEDNSVERIKGAIQDRDWDDWVRVLSLDENAGFSAGNNAGIRAVNAETYLLLNSDTIVHSGAVQQLTIAAQRYPEAGIIGPRLESVEGVAQVSCFKFPSFFSELIRGACTGHVTRLFERWDVPKPVTDESIETPWISFAAVLIRRRVLEEVGLMDNGYFMYFEDVDYCRRVQDAGWKIRYCPAATIVHFHGQSSGVEKLEQARKRRPCYYYEARTRYFRKWTGRLGLIAANLGWCVGRTIGLARELLGREPRSCQYEWADNWKAFCSRSKTTETEW